MQVLTGGGTAGMQATWPPVAGAEDFQKTLIPLSEKRPKKVPKSRKVSTKKVVKNRLETGFEIQSSSLLKLKACLRCS